MLWIMLTDDGDRTDTAIEAAADALLAMCAVQTGANPADAARRALDAIATVYGRAEREAHHAD
jgi:ribonucleotide monophosphatase NagD (HAD superfamily)